MGERWVGGLVGGWVGGWKDDVPGSGRGGDGMEEGGVEAGEGLELGELGLGLRFGWGGWVGGWVGGGEWRTTVGFEWARWVGKWVGKWVGGWVG